MRWKWTKRKLKTFGVWGCSVPDGLLQVDAHGHAKTIKILPRFSVFGIITTFLA